MAGRLRVGGDVRVLPRHSGHRARCSELDDVFASVRAATTCDDEAPRPTAAGEAAARDAAASEAAGVELATRTAPMPELPEIQAHAERLTRDFGGLELAGFRAIAFTALKTFSPPPVQAVGQPLVAGVGRRGKYLLLDFGAVTFVVHLMQGGRLKPDEKQSAEAAQKAAWPAGCSVPADAEWAGATPPALRSPRPGPRSGRGCGSARVCSTSKSHSTASAPTPTPSTRRPHWRQICGAHSMRLHGLLRDQHAIAGIGRRLANEISHRARLSPFANASKLDADEVARLHEAIGACIDESLAYERSRDDMSSSKERPGEDPPPHR